VLYRPVFLGVEHSYNLITMDLMLEYAVTSNQLLDEKRPWVEGFARKILLLKIQATFDNIQWLNLLIVPERIERRE
jgi:hypothetical protein